MIPSPRPSSWARRNGFPDAGLSLLWLLAAFLLFQLTAGLVAAALLVASGELTTGADLMEVMMRRVDLVFIGNSAGQILFLGLATFAVVKLHLEPGIGRRRYLRVRALPDTGRFIALAAVLFIVAQPVVWFLGWANSQLPFPEGWTELQRSQYELIEGFLKRDASLAAALFNVSVVPALCEEVLFRGYLLRSFERSFRAVTAIVFSGLLFGMYHVQPANLLPLATLGVLLGLLTWASGSIWPAVVAHFINNAGAVIAVTRFPDTLASEMSSETMPPVWLVLLSLALTVAVVGAILKAARTRSTVEEPVDVAV